MHIIEQASGWTSDQPFSHWFVFLQSVPMELCDLSMVPMRPKAVWNSAATTPGALCATMSGKWMTPLWCADSSVSLTWVSFAFRAKGR